MRMRRSATTPRSRGCSDSRSSRGRGASNFFAWAARRTVPCPSRLSSSASPQRSGAFACAWARPAGWCSGAAQDELVEAASLGCDVYISGEISERTTYEARENGILYLACGHHATETLGIRALGRHIKNLWPELEIFWFDDENPV